MMTKGEIRTATPRTDRGGIGAPPKPTPQIVRGGVHEQADYRKTTTVVGSPLDIRARPLKPFGGVLAEAQLNRRTLSRTTSATCPPP